MALILRFIKDEILAILPALLFFFAAFNLLVLTEDLATEEYGLKIFHFAGATIGALLVAKALLIVDALPATKVARQGPLIHVTLWKTLLYLIAAVLVAYLERLIPLTVRMGSLAGAHRALFHGVIWVRGLAILIWLVVLLFVFAAFQELARALGQGSVRRMFFGR